MLGHLREVSGSHQAGILVLASFLLLGAVLLGLWHTRITRKAKT